MKNSNTKTTKKVVTKKTKPETSTPAIELNLTGDVAKTDANMVKEIAWAKMDAGRMLDPSEVMNILNFESEDMREFYSSVIKNYREYQHELICEVNTLRHKLNWATRPWYKKLMFWKKMPTMCVPCSEHCNTKSK